MATFEYHTTRGVGTVPKFASVSAPAAVAWVRQWVALHQERRPMRLLKIVEIIEEEPETDLDGKLRVCPWCHERRETQLCGNPADGCYYNKEEPDVPTAV